VWCAAVDYQVGEKEHFECYSSSQKCAVTMEFVAMLELLMYAYSDSFNTEEITKAFDMKPGDF
jgi:hypothetical protein